MEGFQLREALDKRRSEQLHRERLVLDGPQGAEVLVNGKRYLAFCSNDYLGLANHPAVIARFQQAANRYGLGGGASHMIIGHSRAHHELEEALATFTRRPRALLFSTGYMANLGVISALVGRGGLVCQDRLNHASLLDAGKLSGARVLRYRHADSEALTTRLSDSNAQRKLIVTDGVFSMDGDLAPLCALESVAKNNDACLVVDDAHGFGFLGEGGRGSISHWQLSIKQVPVLVGTLGKAFGTSGAFVAGSEELIETLIQFSRSYIYTTAMPPAIADATQVSLQILESESWRREHLTDLIKLFRDGCHAMGIPLIESMTPIQPILVGSVEKTLLVSRKLAELGILITAIRPPTVPRGEARLRVTFSASHSRRHVDYLLTALNQVQGLLITSN